MDTITNTAIVSRVTLDSFNPEAMVDTIQQSKLDHVQLDKGRFLGHLVHADLCSAYLDRGCYNRRIVARGLLSPHRITLGFFLKIPGEATVLGRRLRQGDVVAFSEGSELHCQLPAGTDWVGFQVERERLAACGIDLPSYHNGILEVSAEDRERLACTVLSAFDYLRDIEQLDHAVPDAGKGQASIQDVLLTAFAAAIENVATHPGCADRCPAPTRYLQIVNRAGDYIQAHIKEPVRIVNVCEITQTSVRGLERAFRAVYGIGPKHYLTRVRLNKVRQELLTLSREDTLVTNVAMKWGFSHLGRFSTTYHSVFGETPSCTLNYRSVHGAGGVRIYKTGMLGLPGSCINRGLKAGFGA